MTIIQNMAWYFPVIMAVAGGEKAIANWDEDAVSMAVAAAYDCMAGKDRKKVDGMYLASTTLPFADRLNAGIVAAALNFREEGLGAADFSACMKAGTTASIAAVEAVKSGGKNSVLVVASDQRRSWWLPTRGAPRWPPCSRCSTATVPQPCSSAPRT